MYLYYHSDSHVLYQTVRNMNTTYNNELLVLIMNSDCWLFRGEKNHRQQNINVEKKHLLCVLRVLWSTVRRKMSMVGELVKKNLTSIFSYRYKALKFVGSCFVNFATCNSLILYKQRKSIHISLDDSIMKYLLRKKISCEMMGCRHATYLRYSIILSTSKTFYIAYI